MSVRIEAEIEIVELDDTDISAYTYERTMVMEQRMKLLKEIQNTPTASPSRSPMRNLRSASKTKVIQNALKLKFLTKIIL